MSEHDNLKLSKAERHELIKAKLREYPAIRVSELAADINVSTETIRRDLNELEKLGLISRTYGGAARPMVQEAQFDKRDKLYVRQRDLIAKALLPYIKDGEVLLIGGGATTVHVAIRLAAERKNLRIFTDSIAVAGAMATNPTITTHLCPGVFNDRENCVYGPETINYLNNIYANHTILGASGLTCEGVNNADPEIAQTYQVMVRHSSETTIVADHSKIAQNSVCTYATWQDVRRLVTDVSPYDEELMRGLKLGKVEIVVAEDNFMK